MNSLSWFLYFAGVVGGLKTGLAIFGTIVLILGTIISAIVWAEYEVKWPAYTTVLVGPLLLVLSALTPSQNTMYAIAASEMGEKALESMSSTKAMQALESWLDKQLVVEKKKD